MIVPFNVNKVSDKLLIDYLDKFPNKSAFLRTLVYSYMYMNGEEVPKEALISVIPLSMQQPQFPSTQNLYRGGNDFNQRTQFSDNTKDDSPKNYTDSKDTKISSCNNSGNTVDYSDTLNDTPEDSSKEEDFLDESVDNLDIDLSELESSEAFANALDSMNGFS